MGSPKTGNPMGRPSSYTPEFAKIVCDRIASSPLRLDQICNMYEDMPSSSTIFLWMHRHPDFLKLYEEAQRIKAYAVMEDSLSIIDSIHEYEFLDSRCDAKRVDPGILGALKARIHHRTAICGKFNPERFGRDRQEQETTDSLKVIQDKMSELVKSKEQEC